MPKVEFASSIRKHIPEVGQESSPANQVATEIAGSSVRAVLEAAFARHSDLRGYVLDDQGHVRKHVVIFLNDQPIADRESQSDAVDENDHIFVFQALSGG